MFLHDAGSDVTTAERDVAALREANKAFEPMFAPGGTAAKLDVGAVEKALGFVPTIVETFAVRGRRMQALLSPELRAEFAGRDPFGTMLERIDVAGQMRGRAAVHQAMYLWSKTVFPSNLLNYLGDRSEMAHSIEGRTPFLDHHLVEAVVAMPLAMKVRATTEKYVLREAARPYITDTVYRRQKHLFLAPFDLKGAMLELVEDTLRGAACASIPFFDQQAVIKMLDRLPPPKFAAFRNLVSPVLLMATSACILHERYRL
jgi:asparagine synthase (glutamine-hydrolysing)